MTDAKRPENYTGLWVSTNDADAFMRYEQEFQDGVENGRYRQIDIRTNVALREGFKVDGLDHGQVTLRNSDGKVLSTYMFNYRTGTHLIFTAGDRVGWEIPYENGKVHGVRRRFEFGKLVAEDRFERGKLVG